jgi:hypothetical protein
MAFLEQDAKPLVAGWGPPQQLHAPDIGSTLGAILRNRIAQQQQTQDALTAAIKAQQDRNSSAAYIQAAQNAGVLPQGDYSGMSEKAASDLAQRIQDQTPDTDEDALHKAQAAQANAMADWIKSGKPPGAAQGVDLSEHALGDIWIDPDTGIRMRQTTRGPQPLAVGIQSTNVRPPSQDQNIRLQSALSDQLDALNAAAENEKKANMAKGAGGLFGIGADPSYQNKPFSQEARRQAVINQLKQLQQSNIQPSGTQQDDTQDQTGQPQTNNGAVDILKERQAAQDAIAAGKDPDAVKQRFHDRTGGVF